MACKKCDPHEICEECPEWIFTLADLIMCMMGLFVVLWVLKEEGKPNPSEAASAAAQENSPQLIATIAGIREAFGHVPDPDSTDPVDLHLLQRRQNGPGERGMTDREPEGAEGTQREVEQLRPGPQATVGGKLPFAAGSAELSADARVALAQIADRVRGYRNVVLVKGHATADDADDSAALMALSTRRAERVVAELIALGVSPDVLRPQGCGAYEPVVRPAWTRAAQDANRRAEVEVTQTLVNDLSNPLPTGMPAKLD